MSSYPKYKSAPIKPSEITPEDVYLSRRQFIKAMGMVGAGALLAACAPQSGSGGSTSPESGLPAVEDAPADTQPEMPADVPNTHEEISNFNNFYEFTTDKTRVADLAKDFKTSPWQVEVYGLVDKPKTFGLEDLLNGFDQEERIYRMRCVEGWSMVIPWMGFSLSALLKQVEPLSTAKYVRFETLLDEEQMPGLNRGFYPWPYQEGLRIDEAMNDLTILATGLYGKELPPQNGSPIRLVVPWKYGFKSIKSIIKIELTDNQPSTMWSTITPREYGFYANVNPQVNHPRWSQASERRIGEAGRRETFMFNGYAEEVAYLYEGMDLRQNY